MKHDSIVEWFFDLIRDKGGSIVCDGVGGMTITLGLADEAVVYNGSAVTTAEALRSSICTYYEYR